MGWVAIIVEEGQAINLSWNWGDTGKGLREGTWVVLEGRNRVMLYFNFFKKLSKIILKHIKEFSLNF